jgi:membrane dipeptidase
MANLQSLFDAGVACMTVAHFYPNHLAAPCFPYPEFAVDYLDILGDSESALINHDLTMGLTPLGEEVVEAMLTMGMLVDVTHSTPAARAGIYVIAERTGQGNRVVATHIGAQAINPSPYNLEDWEIRKIATLGGLIGVILMPYWTQPHERTQGLDFLSRTIEHIITVGNEDVIAIGSDLDGFTDPPDELAHYGQMPRIAGRLMAEYRSELEEKYSDELVIKILGGNALRVLVNGWGKTSGACGEA